MSNVLPILLPFSVWTFVGTLLSATAACAPPIAPSTTPTPFLSFTPPTPPTTPSPRLPITATLAEPPSRVRLLLEPPRTRADSITWTRLVASHRLDRTVDDIRDTWRLPDSVSVRLEHCGAARSSPYWLGAKRAIILCYEFFAYLRAVVRDPPYVEVNARRQLLRRGFRHAESQRNFEARTLDPVIRGAEDFALAHEVAHMLFDLWDIPLTGRLEDAADQYAMRTLIGLCTWDPFRMLGPIRLFQASARRPNALKAWSAPHALPLQRAVNIACWAYGAESFPYIYLLFEVGMSSDRIDSCDAEFERFNRGLNDLLDPYRRR